MIINTFSYLWSTTAIDAITELVDNGYTTFEVPISSPHCWPEEISEAERSAIKAKLDMYGATIRSLNAGGYDINLASPGANMRRKSIDHIKSVIDLAVAWDVPEVVISPGTRRPMISPPPDRTYGWMYESLESLLPLAKQAGKRLLMENTPYCFTPQLESWRVSSTRSTTMRSRSCTTSPTPPTSRRSPSRACSPTANILHWSISPTPVRTYGVTTRSVPE